MEVPKDFFRLPLAEEFYFDDVGACLHESCGTAGAQGSGGDFACVAEVGGRGQADCSGYIGAAYGKRSRCGENHVKGAVVGCVVTSKVSDAAGHATDWACVFVGGASERNSFAFHAVFLHGES